MGNLAEKTKKYVTTHNLQTVGNLAYGIDNDIVTACILGNVSQEQFDNVIYPLSDSKKYRVFRLAGELVNPISLHACRFFKVINVSNCSIDQLNSLNGFFNDCLDAEKIVFGNNFNTKHVVDMRNMFKNCVSLVDFSFINSLSTDSAKYLQNMFDSCTLPNIDLTQFNLANVTDMSCMFMSCKYLEHANMSNLTLPSLTSMNSMFSCCNKLETVNMQNLNVNNVTDMSYMFQYSEGLQTIDMSTVRADNVTTIEKMFEDCPNLVKANLSGLTLHNASNIAFLFKDCKKLTDVNISSFDTSNLNNISYLFYGCKSLKSIDLSHFNTDTVTSASCMFKNCTSLESVDINNFNIHDNLLFKEPLYGCTALKQIKLENVLINKERTNFSRLHEKDSDGRILLSMINSCLTDEQLDARFARLKKQDRIKEEKIKAFKDAQMEYLSADYSDTEEETAGFNPLKLLKDVLNGISLFDTLIPPCTNNFEYEEE